MCSNLSVDTKINEIMLRKVAILILSILKVNSNVKKSGLIYMLEWLPCRPKDVPIELLELEQKTFVNRQCAFQNCFFTDDPLYFTNISDFDVVIFSAYNIIPDMDLPLSRSENQIYVLFGWEHKDVCPLSSKFNNFFNLTWTYKLKSDVVYPYLVIRDKENKIIGPKVDMHWLDIDDMKPTSKSVIKKLQNKNKAAMWMVSRCETKNQRFEFVKSLQTELDKYGHTIDIFGKCGKTECPRGEEMDQCYGLIETDYYFYLAFENSYNEDYVTEKVLHALEHFAVPIVYGGANYTRFMPEGIYLNARELGPEKLATKMNDIILNEKRYHDFFKWHRHYSFHDTAEDSHNDDFCALCAKLNDVIRNNETKVYGDIVHWYNGPLDDTETCFDIRIALLDPPKKT